MREIKFRAWDKKLEIWVNPLSVGINLLGQPVGPDVTWFRHDLADLTLMQFTGRRDKKEREIYEHDILPGGWIVIWNDRRGCYELADSLENGAREPFEFTQNDEIIGNIHQNPELTKEDL
jgi:hypothetical protein